MLTDVGILRSSREFITSEIGLLTPFSKIKLSRFCLKFCLEGVLANAFWFVKNCLHNYHLGGVPQALVGIANSSDMS